MSGEPKKIDKDLVILKAESEQIKDIEKIDKELDVQIQKNKQDFEVMKADLEEIKNRLGIKMDKKDKPLKAVTYTTEEDNQGQMEYNYDALFDESINILKNKGIDYTNLSFSDLLDEDTIRVIEKDLNRPLQRREKWTKEDKIVVFIAAMLGSVADLYFGNRNNALTGKNSPFSKWLDKYHIHPKGSAMDYQGDGFGIGDHRVMSKAHDIFRFIETIWNIKNGRFEGIKYVGGKAVKFVTLVNQNGTPYETMTLIEAIINYAKHIFGDFFSKDSLPIPGFSFLVECSNSDVRSMAILMYRKGFNLKNIFIQGISTVLIELILRVYMAVSDIKRMKEEGKSFNILEDFSNAENIKDVALSAANPKYREMFLLTHSIVTAFDIGKIIIKKAPWEINVTEILATVRYLIPYVKDVLYRHSKLAIYERNHEQIMEEWDTLLSDLEQDKVMIPMPSKALIIG